MSTRGQLPVMILLADWRSDDCTVGHVIWSVVQVLFREDMVGGRESKEKIEIEEGGIYTP